MKLNTVGASCRAEDRLTPDTASVGPICLGIATFVWVWMFGALLLLAASSDASAANTASELAPIDVLEYYVGAVDTNNCCDCHSTFC